MAAMERAGGLWFGWSGDLARQPSPPRLDRWRSIEYATVDLDPRDHQAYYAGFANSVLWPVFHHRPDLMVYRAADFAGYLDVNRQFARQLLPLLRPDDTLWIHDYHLIPLARLLREAGVASPIGFFLHTPFPPLDLLRTIPNYQGLLADLFACDLIGFQTRIDLRGFEEAVIHGLGGRVEEGGLVRLGERAARTGIYPIGIETDALPRFAEQGSLSREYCALAESLGGRRLILGVDRLDYSKGLPERLRAYELLLERYPEVRRQVVYLQIAPVSRAELKAYSELAARIDAAAGHVIGTWADFDWVPLRHLKRGYRRSTVVAMYRLAKVGLVTPLRDGMNLVAKEYVAAQDPDDPGVLVLSKMAGAALELDAALLVNPYDPEGVAEALRGALTMPLEERRDRWRRMMQILAANDIHRWHQRFLADLTEAHAALRGLKAASGRRGRGAAAGRSDRAGGA
ncbi:MAG: trehalose-6-phosphate synthase [Porticoccaceae bacterium]|nr:MAG: trehalose-6-phosphate synthase [Porticoccaceae bacterium]